MNFSAAVTAAGKTVAGIAKQAATMTPAVAKNLAGRSGNIPKAELFPKIPQGVRMGGENSILAFLRRVDVSHKLSIRNAPNQASSSDNVVLEASRVNQARGARDMSRVEVTTSHVRNALDGFAAGLRRVPTAAMRAGLTAAAMELPVSGTANLIHYRRGIVSGKQAFRNTARDVVATSLSGAVFGGGVVAVAALGLPVASPVAVGLSVVGTSAYGLSSVRRIRAAVTQADSAFVRGS